MNTDPAFESEVVHPENVYPATGPIATGAAIPASPGVAEYGVELPPFEQWQFAPYLQWSMQNIETFLPVHPIRRGDTVAQFSRRPAAISGLEVKHPWQDRFGSFAQVMAETCTDGWMVCHNGVIVAEHYAGTFTEHGMHLLMSVSKSLTATTAGILSEAGKLDLDGQVTDYVPELRQSGYTGATVRNLVDMRSGIEFSEEYLNDDAEVRLLEEAIGWAPKRHQDVPGSLLGFLTTLKQKAEHGGPFEYKSCETDVLGFVIEGAVRKHTADAMSDLLWQPMGAEFDAHVGVDSVGGGMFDGGVSSAMRDLARFGHLFINNGRSLHNRQVVPQAWVEDTFAGGADSREAFAQAAEPTLMPRGMYRNGFWFPSASGDVMLALGIHGQMIYIDRISGMVGVKLSSWPTPQDPEKLFWTVRAFDAASYALAAKLV
jgi:CubicO group peptidase (beta-lactamase class C family)